jgi:hypothetical protein
VREKNAGNLALLSLCDVASSALPVNHIRRIFSKHSRKFHHQSYLWPSQKKGASSMLAQGATCQRMPLQQLQVPMHRYSDPYRLKTINYYFFSFFSFLFFSLPDVR